MQAYNNLVSSEFNFIKDMQFNFMTDIESIEDIILRSNALEISEDMIDMISIGSNDGYCVSCIKVDNDDSILVASHNKYNYGLIPLNSINSILNRSEK